MWRDGHRTRSVLSPFWHRNWEGAPFKSLWCPCPKCRATLWCPFAAPFLGSITFRFPHPHTHTHFSITRLDGILWFRLLEFFSGTPLEAPKSLYLGLNSTIFRGGFEWQAFSCTKQKKIKKKRFSVRNENNFVRNACLESNSTLFYSVWYFFHSPRLKNLINFAKLSTSV